MKKITLLSSLANYEDGIELIARKLGHEYIISNEFDLGAINVCTIDEAKKNSEFNLFAERKGKDERWHIIFKTSEGGYIICGDRKVDAIHALLKCLDRYDEDIKEYNVSRFNRL